MRVTVSPRFSLRTGGFLQAAAKRSTAGRICRAGSVAVSAISSLGRQERTFVSLNDLAKLTPFGSSNGDTETGKGDATQIPDVTGGDQYAESVTLPFPREHLFGVVSDVDAYHEFVPYCSDSRILAKGEGPVQHLAAPSDLPSDQRQFLAELTVGFGSLQEQYTSRVTLVDQQRIVAEAIPTPLFQHLRTAWSLTSVSPTSTRVDFTIHYAFANPLYGALAKASMHKMARQMIGAFEQRAAAKGKKG